MAAESSNTLVSQLDESASYLSGLFTMGTPRVGLILGSGLGPLAESVENPICVPYTDVPHMAVSTSVGHAGRFVYGQLGGKVVLIMQGRLHGYEGYSSQEIAYPIWLMHKLGVETLVTTNAAGAINEAYRVGDFCLIEDHINFTGRNPVAAMDPSELAFRFFSMKDAYDPAYRALFKQIAQEHNERLQEGVYLGLLGPSFETAAEICMFRGWGADTVAMSLVEEVIAARHIGIRVLGVSLISNMACGVENANPTDEEIFEVAQTRVEPFVGLVKEFLVRL